MGKHSQPSPSPIETGVERQQRLARAFEEQDAPNAAFISYQRHEHDNTSTLKLMSYLPGVVAGLTYIMMHVLGGSKATSGTAAVLAGLFTYKHESFGVKLYRAGQSTPDVSNTNAPQP